MRRISVVGTSGSGKTTLAAEMSARLGIPHVELDGIYHQAGWVPLEDAEFRARVRAVTAGEAWIVDGNYTTVRDVVWGAADTVVALDLPRRIVMSRVVRRSVYRALTRRELWNGNRERLRNLARWDPEDNIIRWAWVRHAVHRERLLAATDDPAWEHLTFVRLGSRGDVAAFITGLGRRD